MSIFGKNILEVTPTYKNSETKIFEDEFFDGKAVRLQIDDKNFFGKIQMVSQKEITAQSGQSHVKILANQIDMGGNNIIVGE